MNYFAHGRRFLDRPYYLAGTAVPDWLSVADRKVRMRTPRVLPFADGSPSPTAELAAGVLQHLHDDGWFHRTPAFHEVTGTLTRVFREALPVDDDIRPSFLGHIVMELLLDAVLIRRDSTILADYYDVLEAVDPAVIQDAVNQLAREPTQRLAEFVPLFVKERFLWDYLDSERLLWRLNQVLRRVRLAPLPAAFAQSLEEVTGLVERRVDDLLTEPSSDGSGIRAYS